MSSATCPVYGPLLGQSGLCAPILRALPDWFGIESATRQYIQDIDGLPTFLAQIESETIGFLSLKLHNSYAAEIHVMGILPGWHKQGIGRALLEAAQNWLRTQGVEYLQVKTLSASHPDPFYARTRAFYNRLGFRPLEEFPSLWGSENPCLLLVKAL